MTLRDQIGEVTLALATPWIHDQISIYLFIYLFIYLQMVCKYALVLSDKNYKP